MQHNLLMNSKARIRHKHVNTGRVIYLDLIVLVSDDPNVL